MADADTIAELRRLIDEADQTSYTDQVLSDRLDAAASVAELAATIWTEKAARYSGLIDVQEGSSNRKMSQLYAQALKMAGHFGTVETGTTRVGASRTRQIERA